MAPARGNKNAAKEWTKPNARVGDPVTVNDAMKDDSQVPLKRKAEVTAADKRKKRAAFGDLTNAIEKTSTLQDLKRGLSKIIVPKNKHATYKSAKVKKTETKGLGNLTGESKEDAGEKVLAVSCDSLLSTSSLPSSLEALKTDDNSVYETAVEDSPDDPHVRRKNERNLGLSVDCKNGQEETPDIAVEVALTTLPEGVDDFDQETFYDPYQMGCYAMDIFSYYKERELLFPVSRYLEHQQDVTKGMRAILVDWMVEVQESFELNHETLYLAVKLVDLYLTKVNVGKEILQLVGSTSLFIACKFDERCPPLVDDFLYICDDAYNRQELLQMEINLLKTVGFDLGIPLSYRFLRRYARCLKLNMETLTLARYILELSLMEYEFVDTRDSLLATAALLVAVMMKGVGKWSPALSYYTGYSLREVSGIVQRLHAMLCQTSKEHLKTIRSKYSHKVFFEVAKVPVLPNQLEL